MGRPASSDVLPTGWAAMIGMVFAPDHGCFFFPEMVIDE